MSGLIPPAAILPTVLGTRIVLGKSQEQAEVLGAAQSAGQSAGGPDLLGALLPFTGYAILVYLAIVVGLIVTGFILSRVGRGDSAVNA
ncbi:MAG TPA: hypothetical protein VNC78_10245 [Actinomycetota bacterium]|nr:hypothetical protein [Actinomycetota bacterium]